MGIHSRVIEVKQARRNRILRLTATDYYMGLFFIMLTVFVIALLGARLLV